MNVIFIHFLSSLIVQNSKKFLRGHSDLYLTYHFRAQNDPFALKNFFFQKNHFSKKKVLLHLLASFHCVNFRKNRADQTKKSLLRVNQYIVMMICYLWIQNSPFAPKKYFVRKIINVI